MRNILGACLLIGSLFTSSAWAISVDAQVEGPLLTRDGVIEFVRQNVEGAMAGLPDLEQEGKYRLFIRVASKHIGPGSRFLYLAEVQLQRRVTDIDTRRTYWASIRSAVLWGNVPTENEVREALGSLMGDKVSRWETE
jgi:hypothetical protein